MSAVRESKGRFSCGTVKQKAPRSKETKARGLAKIFTGREDFLDVDVVWRCKVRDQGETPAAQYGRPEASRFEGGRANQPLGSR